MDTYTYKCIGCGGALVFDASTQLLLCENCGQLYSPDTFSSQYGPAPTVQNSYEQTPSILTQSQASSLYSQTASIYNEQTVPVQTIPQEPINQEPNPQTTDAYMEMSVYRCSSCGAEVMSRGEEVSKFCSFCGQSTILFDRITNEKRPQKIIPFKITKEQAIGAVRMKYVNAKYLPDNMSELSIDTVHGIYMPYYNYNCNYSMSGTVRIPYGDNGTRVVDCGAKRVHNVFLDASEKLNNDVSIYLNPFPAKAAVPFDPTYLQGYYADRSDVANETRVEDAKKYIKELACEDAIKDLPGIQSRYMREQYKELNKMKARDLYEPVVNREDFQVNFVEYLFCPVYFITFRTEIGLAIILVNGYTGKIIGAVPINQEKIKKKQRRDMLLWSIALGLLFAFAFRYAPIIWIGVLGFMAIAFPLLSGRKAKKKYEEILHSANAESMFHLTRNR